MIGIKYKDTFAAKGSQLYAALTEGPESERAKKAKDVYTATTERMKALVPAKAANASCSLKPGQTCWCTDHCRFPLTKEK